MGFAEEENCGKVNAHVVTMTGVIMPPAFSASGMMPGDLPNCFLPSQQPWFADEKISFH